MSEEKIDKNTEQIKLEEGQEIKKNEASGDSGDRTNKLEQNLLDQKIFNDLNDENILNSSSKSDTNLSKKRYFGIDLIRVIACFLVMQTHAGEIFYIDTNGDLITDKKNIYPGIFNSLARVCVPLFIMISGYLLLPMKTDYKTFLKKRFTRISFPFIAFCIFYDIYFFILGNIDIKTMFINIPKIFINYGTEIGHLWYIYMIMGVYLFIPIITPWIQTAKKEHFYYYFVLWLISSFSC